MCMVEILRNIMLVSISSQFHVQRHLMDSLKSEMVEVFTPWKLAKTTNCPRLLEEVVKHLPGCVSAEASL